MKIESLVSDNFEFHPQNTIPFSEGDIQVLKNFSPIKLPDDYLTILRTIGKSVLTARRYNITLHLWSLGEIEDWNELVTDFVEYVPDGITIGDDLGDILYYYGIGKDGIGYYAVEKGAENFFLDAYKFSDFLFDFLQEDLLIKQLSNWIRFGDSNGRK